MTKCCQDKKRPDAVFKTTPGGDLAGIRGLSWG
jgi:hypothetical protein